MQKSARMIAAASTRPGRRLRLGSFFTSPQSSEAKPNMFVELHIWNRFVRVRMAQIVFMLTSPDCGGKSLGLLVGLFLLVVPCPCATSKAWELKSVVVNL